jgi:hypothetical protein
MGYQPKLLQNLHSAPLHENLHDALHDYRRVGHRCLDNLLCLVDHPLMSPDLPAAGTELGSDP